MDIQTVAQNLRNTITGKRLLLTQLTSGPYCSVDRNMARYVELNVKELESILADVEQCLESK